MAAILYARPWRPAAAGDIGQTIEQLERAIASGNASPQTWQLYGQRLFDAGDFARAAMAYEKVIEAEPYHRPARFQRGLSLAKAHDREGLLAYLRSQLHQEPKLVAELIDRPELQASMSDPRYIALAKEAHAQAMD